MELQFLHLNTTNLKGLVQKQQLKPKDKFTTIYSDFHYFSGYDFTNDDVEFIVALDGDIIIGILKYSINICQEYALCWDIQPDCIYTAMRYIDIKEGYKNKGIGTQMIQKFNETIDKSIPLVISSQEDEGLIVGTHRMFDKHMTDVILYFYTSCGYTKNYKNTLMFR
jgi:GNAT superfamily N-acetyltransferase